MAPVIAPTIYPALSGDLAADHFCTVVLEEMELSTLCLVHLAWRVGNKNLTRSRKPQGRKKWASKPERCAASYG